MLVNLFVKFMWLFGIMMQFFYLIILKYAKGKKEKS